MAAHRVIVLHKTRLQTKLEFFMCSLIRQNCFIEYTNFYHLIEKQELIFSIMWILLFVKVYFWLFAKQTVT